MFKLTVSDIGSGAYNLTIAALVLVLAIVVSNAARAQEYTGGSSYGATETQSTMNPAVELAKHRAYLVATGKALHDQKADICSRQQQKERGVCEHDFLSAAVIAALTLYCFDDMEKAADAGDLKGLAARAQ